MTILFLIPDTTETWKWLAHVMVWWVTGAAHAHCPLSLNQLHSSKCAIYHCKYDMCILKECSCHCPLNGTMTAMPTPPLSHQDRYGRYLLIGPAIHWLRRMSECRLWRGTREFLTLFKLAKFDAQGTTKLIITTCFNHLHKVEHRRLSLTWGGLVHCRP
jgi:hypothetical protein